MEKYDEFKIVKRYDVETISINDILNSMDKCPDLITIDIEEMDLEVLKSMNFNIYKPLVIAAELNAWGKHKRGNI